NPGRSVEISKQPPDFCHHCKFALIFHMSPPLKLAKALWNPHAHLPFAQCGCCTRNRRIASASALATPRLVSPYRPPLPLPPFRTKLSFRRSGAASLSTRSTLSPDRS